MAVLTHPIRLYPLRIGFVKKLDRAFEKFLPRPCMLVSASLVLAGMCIPMLMIIETLPLSLGLFFLAFILVITGSISALILHGEL